MKKVLAIIIEIMIITCVFVLSGCNLSPGPGNDKKSGSSANEPISTSSGPKRAVTASQVQQLAYPYAGYPFISGAQGEICKDPNNPLKPTYDIGYMQDGAVCNYPNVSFPYGMVNFTASVASGGSGGTIEVWGGYPSTKLFQISVNNTGGWQNWTTVSCHIPNYAGLNLGNTGFTLIFHGVSGNMFNIDSVTFQGLATPTSGGAIFNKMSIQQFKNKMMAMPDYQKGTQAQITALASGAYGIWAYPFGGHYQLVSPYTYNNQGVTTLVLGVDAGSTDDGARIIQWTIDNPETANQLWDFVPVGDGSYKIQNVGSGKFIGVDACIIADGRPLIQWHDDGFSDKQWIFMD